MAGHQVVKVMRNSPPQKMTISLHALLPHKNPVQDGTDYRSITRKEYIGIEEGSRCSPDISHYDPNLHCSCWSPPIPTWPPSSQVSDWAWPGEGGYEWFNGMYTCSHLNKSSCLCVHTHAAHLFFNLTSILAHILSARPAASKFVFILTFLIYVRYWDEPVACFCFFGWTSFLCLSAELGENKASDFDDILGIDRQSPGKQAVKFWTWYVRYLGSTSNVIYD